ncbi:cof-like hydrolase [Eggerthia catenaformis OT 569 = DSM 20559]|uniref:Cof-like hydrolase n=1 Tax=Eggerthia catenaformis OT 569 = DSM 20559 TaxID=999415 RepID=M2P7Y5_9FIRM|nr:Cof-type HAD-IIB family hydrolase [Eggerthia catenaformis]EMD16437.1 cof-like hydrolase [Eggerthia catenaformis OT 569 = DSM 20559]OUC52313.1 HAD family hydrolase [Eggerthia catenaformis]
MNYKLIACDLDETLLNDDHIVPESNIYWIQKARKEHNIKFVPATGRGYMQILPELRQLGLDKQKDEYVLSFNGGALTENKDYHLIDWHGLDFNKMKELFEFGLKQDVCIHVYTNTVLYIYHLSESERERIKHQKLQAIYPDEDSVDFLKDEPIAKILYQNIDVPYLMSLEDQLKDITDGCVSVSYSSNRYMEFNALGVDKGAGLKNLAQKLGCSIEETIAVGDNYNDLTMLDMAGLSVAAGNAVEDVKKACDYTTKANNNEGVVAELIRKFIYHEDI